jgi:pyruvate kinase
MRRAKIVCTIGPVTESREQIQALVDAGMDVARINRSHGNQAGHEIVYRNVRAAAQASGRAVAVLVDLQGPKIRLGTFVEGKVELTEGDTFTITTDDVPGTKERASTTYKGLPGDAKVGDQILIDDGRVGVRIVAVEGHDVVTTVELAGPISNNKGLNLPGVAVSVPAMSAKDEEDLRWALKLGADIIALSFVRSAKDYDDVARIMAQEGRVVPVIAKIEKPQAVENLAEIIDAFDGIMVARGDLGVEMPLEMVPLVQKRAVELARRSAKPVIVATQVLESMISAPRPTRAEASDCANAILDGADAVMLSGETSVGDYPIEAVRTMARIIENTEELGRERMAPLGTTPFTRGGAITRAAAEIGEILAVKYLITFTQSGDSARRMSRLRSPIPLLAFTPLTKVRSELALSWGVQTYEVAQMEHSDAMVRQVDAMLRQANLVTEGDLVVIVSGVPMGIAGTTNSILVHKIGQLGGTGTARATR